MKNQETNLKSTTLLFFLLAISFVTIGFSCHETKQKFKLSQNDNKVSDLEIQIQVEDTLLLPSLDGITINLINNTDQTIKIWDNIN